MPQTPTASIVPVANAPEFYHVHGLVGRLPIMNGKSLQTKLRGQLPLRPSDGFWLFSTFLSEVYFPLDCVGVKIRNFEGPQIEIRFGDPSIVPTSLWSKLVVFLNTSIHRNHPSKSWFKNNLCWPEGSHNVGRRQRGSTCAKAMIAVLYPEARFAEGTTKDPSATGGRKEHRYQIARVPVSALKSGGDIVIPEPKRRRV